MKAEIKPLIGKYYGTIIEISNNDGKIIGEIKIWLTDDTYTPSDRELLPFGINHTQYHDNPIVNLDGEKLPVKDAELVCDSHYESHLSYSVAKMIVFAINSMENIEGVIKWWGSYKKNKTTSNAILFENYLENLQADFDNIKGDF